MAIINSNNIMPEHIRLELTESAMFDDFNMVIHNMESLMSQVSSSILMTSELDTLTLKELLAVHLTQSSSIKHCFTNLLITPLYRILYLTLQAYSRNRDLYY